MNYTERRQKNVKVFEDTQAFYTENKKLNEAMNKSRQETVCFDENDYPEIKNDKSRSQNISITGERTFEAAIRLNKENPDSRITVHNFASASNPGGGVVTGASAQEEALCRCSTLYPTLNQKKMWDKYYGINRMNRSVLHTDACIYSPGIVICKTDDNTPVRLPEKEWVYVDVITCAAPNLRENPSNAYNLETGDREKITPHELYEIHLKRAKHILHIAAANNTDIIVLGAFGCGAFKNDPNAVAKAYKDALKEMGGYFEEIVFAVYCNKNDTENYDVFKKIFSE